MPGKETGETASYAVVVISKQHLGREHDVRAELELRRDQPHGLVEELGALAATTITRYSLTPAAAHRMDLLVATTVTRYILTPAAAHRTDLLAATTNHTLRSHTGYLPPTEDVITTWRDSLNWA